LRLEGTLESAKQLQEFEELYTEEFYNGAANDHIMQYIKDDKNFEF